MNTPSLGRIVLYHCDDSPVLFEIIPAGTIVAACITRVDLRPDGGHDVYLMLMLPGTDPDTWGGGATKFIGPVPHGPAPGHWFWPPRVP